MYAIFVHFVIFGGDAEAGKKKIALCLTRAVEIKEGAHQLRFRLGVPVICHDPRALWLLARENRENQAGIPDCGGKIASGAIFHSFWYCVSLDVVLGATAGTFFTAGKATS